MKTGAIATPHALATEAGRDAFAAGGNAIDAALAAAAVLTVVYPHQCAIGGDLFAVIQTSDGRALSINGSGALPSSVNVEEIRRTCAEVPPHGPDSITVPGMVSAWDSIARLGGALNMSDVLAPAIELAGKGAEVSSSLAAGIIAQADVLIDDEGMSEIFLPAGMPLEERAVIRQTALARTLTLLAEQGLDDFYRGTIGDLLVAGLRRLDAKIGKEDLANHRTEESAPLTYGYGEVELMTSPPNSQGYVLLETLAALNAVDLPLHAHGKLARYSLGAAVLAAMDRDAYLGDPRHKEVPLDDLFDKQKLKKRLQTMLDSGIESLFHGAQKAAHGDTVAICTIDDDGNAVSLIQSLYQTFGAGILERQTGVIMHNRARGFSLERGAPNEMMTGMRPAHTLMPLLARRDGAVIASLGTMGGKAQPQILMQILSGVLDLEAPLTESLSAPRWVFGSRDIGFETLTVAIEADAPAELDEHLNLKGLDVVRVGSKDERMGHANVVRVLNHDTLESASDPRSNGLGMTYESAVRLGH